MLGAVQSFEKWQRPSERLICWYIWEFVLNVTWSKPSMEIDFVSGMVVCLHFFAMFSDRLLFLDTKDFWSFQVFWECFGWSDQGVAGDRWTDFRLVCPNRKYTVRQPSLPSEWKNLKWMLGAGAAHLRFRESTWWGGSPRDRRDECSYRLHLWKLRCQRLFRHLARWITLLAHLHCWGSCRFHFHQLEQVELLLHGWCKSSIFRYM